MSGQDLFREFQNRVAQKRDSLRRDDCPEGYAFDEYQEGWRAAFSWATDILGDLVSEQGKDHFANTGKMEGDAGQGVKLHGRILPGPRCNLYIESDCFDRGFGGLNYKFSDSNDVDMFVQIRKK